MKRDVVPGTGGAGLAPIPEGPDEHYVRGRLLVLLGGLFLSLGGPLIRLVEQATEWQFLFYRAVAVIAALLVVIAARDDGRVAFTIRHAGANGVVAGFFLGCAFTGFVFSITHTTVANTLFLLSAAPFLAAILGWLVLREPVAKITWLAMCGAAVGVAIMVGEGIKEKDLFGDLTALGTAAGFACFSVVLRRGRNVDMMPAVLYAGLFSGAVALVMAFLVDGGIAVPLIDVGLACTYGAIGVGAGLVLLTLGSRHVPAAELTLLSLTEVVAGPVWVWIGFSEVPSGPTMIGGAILLASIAARAFYIGR